jgi:hypothetical protein
MHGQQNINTMYWRVPLIKNNPNYVLFPSSYYLYSLSFSLFVPHHHYLALRLCRLFKMGDQFLHHSTQNVKLLARDPICV